MSWTSWRRGPLVTLAACVLLPWTVAGCTGGEAHGHGGTPSPSAVGKVLDGTDDTGRRLREVAAKDAPQVGVEVIPDAGGGWDVRLTFHRFHCSAPGARPTAVTGRGLAHLFVDGHRIARLHGPGYRLPDRLVPRGTHHVTVRLYADDGTVWAVRGKPVQSTADITVSGPGDPAADPAEPSVGTTTPPAGG
ncbi:hypothetical protein [Streptomyces sp. NPDC040750]|uniref:hypothetical protein n=1 Tax=Streptomyces sp. NPDC040750 TaxID=3154491 RepID=UPI0033FD6AB0